MAVDEDEDTGIDSKSRCWITTLVRRIFYDLPATILILDTRLLLKDGSYEPPWSFFYSFLKGAIVEKCFALSTSFSRRKGDFSSSSYSTSKISLFKSGFLFLFSLVTLYHILQNTHEKFEVKRDYVSEDLIVKNFLLNPEIQKFIKKTIIKEKLLRGAKRSVFFSDSHSDLDNMTERYIREEINNHWDSSSWWTEMRSTLSDSLTLLRSRRKGGEGLDTLRMIRERIDKLEMEFAESLAKLSSCRKSRDTKIRLLKSYLRFFRNEEIVLLSSQYFVGKLEYSNSILELKSQLLAKINLRRSSFATSEDKIHRILIQAINEYDSDKTGRFDYALESAGGSIVTTRCTETFIKKTARYKFLGFTVWYPSNNPRTAIQPSMLPGECWAFKGSHGRLVIKLFSEVLIDAFSIEHISKSMTPKENINSAPKDIELYGVRDKSDVEPFSFGRYSYSNNGSPLQTFTIKNQPNRAFRFVELAIHSNHGNANYTCLYRIRIHGAPLKN